MSQKLAGKVAVVTGASKGIGAAIAQHLAAEGAAVAVNYASSKAGAERVVAEIVHQGGKAVAIQADVAKQEDIKRLFAETKKAFGKLDVLVNNAGIYEFMPLENVNYLVIHGSHDGDVSSFDGLRQFQRIKFTDGNPWFKSAWYVYRANHGQWNSVWQNKDNGPRSARNLDLRGLIPLEDQMQFGRVVITAFLQSTLKDRKEYLPMFRDHRAAGPQQSRGLLDHRPERALVGDVVEHEAVEDHVEGAVFERELARRPDDRLVGLRPCLLDVVRVDVGAGQVVEGGGRAGEVGGQLVGPVDVDAETDDERERRPRRTTVAEGGGIEPGKQMPPHGSGAGLGRGAAMSTDAPAHGAAE